MMVIFAIWDTSPALTSPPSLIVFYSYRLVPGDACQGGLDFRPTLKNCTETATDLPGKVKSGNTWLVVGGLVGAFAVVTIVSVIIYKDPRYVVAVCVAVS